MKSLSAYIELLRIPHWIKNVAVLAALPFGWVEHGPGCGLPMAIAFFSFCLASSAIYALNDVLDRHEDLLHPAKKDRPLARGAIRPSAALAWSGALCALSIGLALLIAHRGFVVFVVGYVVLMTAYSLNLKHQPILDVIVIACGFVLRTAAGALAVNIYISPWLIVCTFTLCLFLGFGKRRSEVYAINHAENAARHRPTLTHYSADLLNQLLSTSAGVALVTFMLYIMDTEPQPGQTVFFNKRPLLFTFPLVAYGLFRYAMLIETGRLAGPTDIILKDRVLLAVIIIWITTSGAIILFEPLQQVMGG